MWPPPSANMPKMKPRANFPNHSFHSKRCFLEQPLLPPSILSCISCLQLARKKSGVGHLSSLLNVLICLMEAVVSSFFIALSDVPFLTVKCLDFVECAQQECEVHRLCVSRSVFSFHRNIAPAIVMASTLYCLHTTNKLKTMISLLVTKLFPICIA